MLGIDSFYREITNQLENCASLLNGKDGWIVEGLLLDSGEVIPLPFDTKVISKVVELLLDKKIHDVAKSCGFDVIQPKHQNVYPDYSLVCNNTRLAVDIKTTYRKNSHQINGFTLGSYAGYFKNRNSTKNIVFPYNSYSKHYVLSCMYDLNERRSPCNFECMFHEKWQIASKVAGSGNTKNIGSIKEIERLRKVDPVFLSEREFDSFWLNY